MGYETALHLIDVKIKDESVSIVRKALHTKKGRGLRALVYFLGEAFLPDDGFLCFKVPVGTTVLTFPTKMTKPCRYWSESGTKRSRSPNG